MLHAMDNCHFGAKSADSVAANRRRQVINFREMLRTFDKKAIIHILELNFTRRSVLDLDSDLVYLDKRNLWKEMH